MKNVILLCLILAVFGWMNIATKPNIFYPCETQISNYLYKDSLVNSYYLQSSHDTVIIKAYKDSLWDTKTLTICKMLKDSCQINNYKILVVDTSFDQSTWNTPYGKRLYFRQCQ